MFVRVTETDSLANDPVLLLVIFFCVIALLVSFGQNHHRLSRVKWNVCICVIKIHNCKYEKKKCSKKQKNTHNFVYFISIYRFQCISTKDKTNIRVGKIEKKKEEKKLL